MLAELFGNKSVEKILLFLLVNDKSYPTQVHRLLETPLTPIQKAFERLEKGTILTSYYEGKTRFYHFNPSYPLLEELELLLKKAYSRLPPSEKKRYYYINTIKEQRKKEPRALLYLIYKQLQKITEVNFSARSGINGSQGKGKGSVVVSYENDQTVIFHEEGLWRSDQGQEFRFSNVFRWTYSRIDGMIALEHLRLGVENPVFLFHLIPSGPNLLESHHPHLCGKDTYFGQLRYDKRFLELSWRILGPQKNEEIKYCYY